MNSNSSGSPIDTYLAALPRQQRSALEKLRRIIRAAAPRAEEGVSYGVRKIMKARIAENSAGRRA